MQHIGRTWVVAAGTVVFALIGGPSVITAGGGGSSSGGGPSLSDGAFARAAEAALESTGGGRVTEREAGDEHSAYEIEVTLDDGRHLDVQVDESFTVVRTVTDVEEVG
jgi:hypothetical protein